MRLCCRTRKQPSSVTFFSLSISTASHAVPCLSLFITPESYSGTFSKKSTFLKIPILYTSLIPSPQKTKDEPKKNQGTPKELPIIKKCFLLILTTSSPPLSITAPIALGHLPCSLCPLLPHLMRHLVLLCSLPPNLIRVFSPLHLTLYTFTPKIFAHLQIFHYLCTRYH